MASLIQSAQVLIEKRWTSLEEEGIWPADHLCIWTVTLPWIASLPAFLRTLHLLSLHNLASQFLKIHVYLSLGWMGGVGGSLCIAFYLSYCRGLSRSPPGLPEGNGALTAHLVGPTETY